MEKFIRRCDKCGSILLDVKKCECEDSKITCCGEEMKLIVANEDKENNHTPTYFRQDGKVFIRIDHVMESDHFIEAIIVKTDSEILVHYLKSGDEPELILGYEDNMEIYSLCNKHGLWKVKVV